MKIKQSLFSITTLTVTFCAAVLLLAVTLIAKIPFAWSLLLLIPSALLATYERFIKAVTSAKKLCFDEDILISLAIILIFVSGRCVEGAIAALVVRVIFVADMVLQNKSKKNRTAGLPTVSQTAWIQLDDGTYKEIPADEVEIDMVVLARPYEDEFVPADGIVVQGEGKMLTSGLTGSDEEIYVSAGSVVYSGMKSIENAIHIKVTNRVENSAAAKICKVLSEGDDRNTALRITKKISRFVAPAIFVIAVAVALILIFAVKLNIASSLYVAGVMLLCVHPTLTLSSLTRGFYKIQTDALSKGIVLNHKSALESIASADAVVFDGVQNLFDINPTVEEIIDVNGIGQENVFFFFAALLQNSSLLLARAVKNGISEVQLPSLDRVIEKKGLGTAAEIDGKKFLCGTKELFDLVGIDVEDIDADLYLSIGKKLYGALKIKLDPLSLAAEKIEKISENYTENIFVMVGSDEDISRYHLDSLDKCTVKVLENASEKANFLAELSCKYKNTVLFSFDDEIDTHGKPIAKIVCDFGKGMAAQSADIIIGKEISDRLLYALDFSRKKVSWLRLISFVTLDLSVLLLGFSAFGYLFAPVAAFLSAIPPIVALIIFSGMIKFR